MGLSYEASRAPSARGPAPRPSFGPEADVVLKAKWRRRPLCALRAQVESPRTASKGLEARGQGGCVGLWDKQRRRVVGGLFAIVAVLAGGFSVKGGSFDGFPLARAPP